VLGRHYPSDVLAGWLLAGVVVAGLHAVVDGNRSTGDQPRGSAAR
jgi:membrane-associated phospholipid phosphatase